MIKSHSGPHVKQKTQEVACHLRSGSVSASRGPLTDTPQSQQCLHAHITLRVMSLASVHQMEIVMCPGQLKTSLKKDC